MARKQTSHSSTGASWGTAAGLLAGCGVTMIGIALNLPPLTILLRAFGGGCIVAMMVSLLTFGWQLLTPHQEEE